MSTTSLTPSKLCTKCGNPWPLTPKYWHVRPDAQNGFKTPCRHCRSRATGKRKEWVLANMLAPDGFKVCYVCWEPKPDTTEHFRNRRDRSTGNLQGRCRRCESAYIRSPRRREAMRVHASARRARQRQAGGSYTVADVKQMYEDQGGLCAYCESFLDGEYEVDHMIPLIRGGPNDWSNLAVVCRPCNRRKGTKTLLEILT